MKTSRLIIVTPHCYDKEENKLSTFKDGLSIMVGQIVSGLASRSVEVQVYMTNAIYSNKWRKRENVTYFNNSLENNIHNLGLVRCIKLVLSKQYAGLKDLYFLISNEAFLKTIDADKTVLINFHDLTINNCYLIKKCMEKRIECILTLHMYVGKDSSFGNEYDGLKQREREILQLFSGRIITVSEGMKNRILHDYSLLEDIEVIENGIEIEENQQHCKNSNKKKKQILCAGTIGRRKNQIQLLRALKSAPERIRKECKFIFCGIDTTGGVFETTIKEYRLSDFVTYIGEVDKKSMRNLYLNSFAVISCSLSEAFGLTIIEAYSYGKPCVFFDDIDAVEYLSGNECCVLIKGKEDEDIIKAIDICINTKWSSNKIRKHACKYDMNNTIDKYINCYEEFSNIQFNSK